jgi:tetratricopeptide (TPR) repeat protein
VPLRSRTLLLRLAAGLLIVVAPAIRAGAQSEVDPSGLERAMGAAEDALRRGELAEADVRYREALFEGWLLRAGLEDLAGRATQAREALLAAALFKPESRDGSLRLGVAVLLAGDAQQAVDLLEPVAARLPADSEVLRVLAKAFAAAGETERAASTLDQAAASAPDDPELRFLVATEYLWLKKPDVAERLFAAILAARPSPQMRVLIGRAYRDAGEYERARRELRAALGEDPSVRRAHYYLGMVLMTDATTGDDRLENAVAEFRAELTLAPDDPLASDQLGVALLEAGRSQEALAPLEAAVRGDERPLYLSHLARCQLALERSADAAASARRALDLAEERPGSGADVEKIHYQLGLALRKLGQPQEAAVHFAAARALASQGADGGTRDDATGPAAAAREASLPALSSARRQELEALLKDALARAYFNLGVLQARGRPAEPPAQRFARAAAFFERAAEIDPEFPQLQASWGIACFNARQFDKATTPLSRALAGNPGDAQLRRMLAIAKLNTESYEEAAMLLRGDPGREADPKLQSAYALALVKSGRGAEAEAVLVALLSGQGESAELDALLGQAYAQQDKHAPAVERLTRALDLDPRAADAAATLGLVYLEQGRTSEAAERLKAAVELAPEDAALRDALARAYQKLGMPELAQRELDASRELRARPKDSHP